MSSRTGKNKQKFGAHQSIAGGLDQAFAAGARVGCDCIQIFVKNQRQWTASPLTDEQVNAFRSAAKESGIGPVIAHASYLLNLASPEKASRMKSIVALVDELERCEALGVPGLVIHPGNHMGEGISAGIERIAESLDEAHGRTAGFVTQVLLETTAGQGTSIGHEIVHLGQIIERVSESERLGVCLDTCHLFAAGYDLTDEEDYERLVGELTKYVGLAWVKCMHTNDCKHPCGSRKDRHEHIGKGHIGKVGFARVLCDPRLTHVPRILETPKGHDGRGADMDKVNLGRLRRFAGLRSGS